MGVSGSLPGVDLAVVSKEAFACRLQGSIFYTSPSRLCSRNAANESCCSNHREDCTVKALSCGQERYHQEENGVRHVPPEQIYSLSEVQNDHNQDGQAGNLGGGMDGYARFKKCLLACSDSPQVSTSSGVQNREPGVPIHSHAFRSEHSPANFYQAMFSNRQGAQVEGHQNLCLPRRLDNLGTVVQAMPPSFNDDMQSDREVRLHHKSGEVILHPNSDDSMVGTDMGYEEAHSFFASPISGQSQGSHQEIHQMQGDNPPPVRTGGGSAQLCLHSQSSSQDIPQESQSCSEGTGKESPSRYTGSSVTRAQSKAFILAKAESIRISRSLAISSSHSRSVYGRIGHRMGVPHDRSSGRQRSLETSHVLLSHQSQGVHCSLDSSAEMQVGGEYLNKASLGQHFSSELHQSRGLNEIDTALVLDPIDSSFSGFEELDSVGRAYKRRAERLGRFIVQKSASSGGMDVGQSLISLDSFSGFSAPGRSDGDFPQSPASSLCVPMPGPSGRGSGRHVNQLEQMDVNLHLPSSQGSPYGSGLSASLQGEGDAHCSLVANSILVSRSSEFVFQPQGVPQSSPVAASPRQNSFMRLLLSISLTRLDFLMDIYSNLYGVSTAKYLLKSHRQSTRRQYETAWKSLVCFVKYKKPTTLTISFMLKFFIWLFENRKLQSNTITSYRCALMQPLKLGFSIDLCSEPFTLLIKSFFLERPLQPPREPQWCLDKVLDLLKSDRFVVNPCLKDLTMKVVFLIGLGTGVRISELHSLLRGETFIKFDDGYNSVTLYPNPEFLAKTESATNRRKPIFIRSFKLPSGAHHRLCPVSALRAYLRATNHMSSKKLFINPSSLADCTVLAITGLLRKLVKISQPGVYCAFHDLRKFATSKAFFSLMSCKNIRSRGGWSSNKTFASRYLAKSLGSRVPCVALGSLCRNLVGSV